MSYHFVIYYTLSLEREATPYTRGPRAAGTLARGGGSRGGSGAHAAAEEVALQQYPDAHATVFLQ